MGESTMAGTGSWHPTVQMLMAVAIVATAERRGFGIYTNKYGGGDAPRKVKLINGTTAVSEPTTVREPTFVGMGS